MEIVSRAVVMFLFLWVVTRAVGRSTLGELSTFELLLYVDHGRPGPAGRDPAGLLRHRRGAGGRHVSPCSPWPCPGPSGASRGRDLRSTANRWSSAVTARSWRRPRDSNDSPWPISWRPLASRAYAAPSTSSSRPRSRRQGLLQPATNPRAHPRRASPPDRMRIPARGTARSTPTTRRPHVHRRHRPAQGRAQARSARPSETSRRPATSAHATQGHGWSTGSSSCSPCTPTSRTRSCTRGSASCCPRSRTTCSSPTRSTTSPTSW